MAREGEEREGTKKIPNCERKTLLDRRYSTNRNMYYKQQQNDMEYMACVTKVALMNIETGQSESMDENAKEKQKRWQDEET